MKVQRIVELPPVHAVIELMEDKGRVVTVCGKWLDDSDYREVETEVTCKTCLAQQNPSRGENHGV